MDELQRDQERLREDVDQLKRQMSQAFEALQALTNREDHLSPTVTAKIIIALRPVSPQVYDRPMRRPPTSRGTTILLNILHYKQSSSEVLLV